MKNLLKYLNIKSLLAKPNSFSYMISISAIILVCDQILKYFLSSALKTSHTQSFLGFSLDTVINPHWAFSLQLGLNPLLSFVIYSGLFVILIYMYVIITYYISSLPKLLNISLAILFASILSNLLDKIQTGYVLDFISYEWVPYIKVHFNSSDILQTIAWCLIIYTIILYRKKIWVFNESRKKLLIMKKLQLEFIGYLVVTTICVSIYFIFLNYRFLTYLQNLEIIDETNQIITYFFNYSLVVLIALMIPIIGISIYLSNKIYGPIYAFNKYIKALLDDKNPKDFHLRTNDQLKKELEEIATAIKNKIK